MRPQGALESTWFVVRSYDQLKSVLSNVFSEGEESYPADEAGELVRRQMAKKSWFDKITSWWIGKSFFGKVGYIAGFIFVSGTVGTLVGSSLIFSVVALTLSIVIHKLLALHEENRRETATTSAMECVALGNDLRASKAHFQNTIAHLQNPIEALKSQTKIMMEQSAILESERLSLEARAGTVGSVIECVGVVNDELQRNGFVVSEKLAAISDHIDQCDQRVLELSEAARERGEDLSDFSTTVRNIGDAQKKFTSAVTRFSMFVNAPPPQKEDSEDAILSELMRKIAEDEKLAQEWSSTMSHVC